LPRPRLVVLRPHPRPLPFLLGRRRRAGGGGERGERRGQRESHDRDEPVHRAPPSTIGALPARRRRERDAETSSVNERTAAPPGAGMIAATRKLARTVLSPPPCEARWSHNVGFAR